MNSKKKYEEPSFEVCVIKADDVIATSCSAVDCPNELPIVPGA